MLLEIIAGSIYGSMALLADGWHMGTHVAAFMITLFAYRYARKHENNPAFSFGTGKVSVLGGFASAVALAVVAFIMLIESTYRIIQPHAIHFNEAIVVATIGLLVNLVSALILKDHHHHADGHDHHHDHNLRAAYMHVLADALTSLLAIAALLAGKYFGWHWMDPVMGIVGALIIIRWAFGLVNQTSPILLDSSIEQSYQLQIISTIEADTDNQVSDIHIWRIGGNHYAAMISVVTHQLQDADYYKKLLARFSKISHLTVEVNLCQEESCTSD